MLDNKTLIEILETMNDLLMQNSIKVKLTIYGGALMTFLSDVRPMTRDVDTIINTTNENIFKAILNDIAFMYDLDGDWLNSEIEEPLKVLKKENLKELLSFKNLIVLSPIEEQMLAMKILSARPEPSSDFIDANILCKKLGIKDKSEVLKIFKEYIPIKYMGERQVMFIRYLGEDLGYDWK